MRYDISYYILFSFHSLRFILLSFSFTFSFVFVSSTLSSSLLTLITQNSPVGHALKMGSVLLEYANALLLGQVPIAMVYKKEQQRVDFVLTSFLSLSFSISDQQINHKR